MTTFTFETQSLGTLHYTVPTEQAEPVRASLAALGFSATETEAAA